MFSTCALLCSKQLLLYSQQLLRCFQKLLWCSHQLLMCSNKLLSKGGQAVEIHILCYFDAYNFATRIFLMVHRAIREYFAVILLLATSLLLCQFFLTLLLRCSQQLLQFSHAVLQCSHKLIPMGASISCCGVLLTAAVVL